MMSNIKEMSVLDVLTEMGLNGDQLKIVLSSLNFSPRKAIKDLTKENLINLFATEHIDADDIGE